MEWRDDRSTGAQRIFKDFWAAGQLSLQALFESLHAERRRAAERQQAQVREAAVLLDDAQSARRSASLAWVVAAVAVVALGAVVVRFLVLSLAAW